MDFGSVYICEQWFLAMKHKSNISTTMSNEHCEYSLRIATTSIKPVTDT